MEVMTSLFLRILREVGFFNQQLIDTGGSI